MTDHTDDAYKRLDGILAHRIKELKKKLKDSSPKVSKPTKKKRVARGLIKLTESPCVLFGVIKEARPLYIQPSIIAFARTVMKEGVPKTEVRLYRVYKPEVPFYELGETFTVEETLEGVMALIEQSTKP